MSGSVSMYGFVVFGVLLVIGIVMISSVIQNASSDNVSTDIVNKYIFNFVANPTDSQTLTLDNTVYEFDNNSAVSGSNVRVPIDTTLNGSIVNLKTQIAQNSNYTVS
jgi:hypothetical protein